MDLSQVAADESTRQELLGGYTGAYCLAISEDGSLLLILPPKASVTVPTCIVRADKLIVVNTYRASIVQQKLP